MGTRIDREAAADALVATGRLPDDLTTYVVTETGLSPDGLSARDAALLLLRVRGGASQATMAAAAINMTGGELSSGELGRVLQAAFPDANMGKGRHGPYYLSLARTGKLAGIDRERVGNIRHSVRTAKPAVAETRDPAEDLAERRGKLAEKLYDRLKGMPALRKACKEAGIPCKGKKEDIIVALVEKEIPE